MLSTEDTAKSFRCVSVPVVTLPSYRSLCVTYKYAELYPCFQKLPSIVSLWLLASQEGWYSVHGLGGKLSLYGKDVCQLLTLVLASDVRHSHC